jgi:DNA-binding MurR/RpiR family transcriptional regulator
MRRKGDVRVGGVRSAQVVPDLLAERLTARGDALSPAGRRVMAFIDKNRTVALARSAMELAADTGTSDATVVRSVQALGFAGMHDLKQALLAAMAAPSTPEDDMRRTLEEVGDNTTAAVDLVLKTHGGALEALKAPEARRLITAAVTALHPAARIVVFGVGPSALLACYVAMQLERAGRHSKALDRTGRMLADQLLDLRSGDALLVLAYGRPYREVLAVFAEARSLRLPIVLVTDDSGIGLAKSADVVLLVQRGQAERVALHGTTLIALEAVILGLVAANREVAMASLQRLNALRKSVTGKERDTG